jgi:uncharacterized protein (TIGR03435 family)
MHTPQRLLLFPAALLCAYVSLPAIACAANSTPDTPRFEAVAIKPCAPGTPEPPGQSAGMVRYTYPGGRFEAKATTVEFLLEWSYGLLPSQHSRGPAWMDKDRYDIIGKTAGNPSDEEMKLMVQTLLTERFHLKFHWEKREASVLVLRLGKNAPKLYKSKDGEPSSLKIIPAKDDAQNVISYHVVATRFSFAQLNRTFARQIGRVIVNDTGLDGEYDYTLDFTPDENRPNPLDPSLWISALQYQLGLTVTSQKGPVDFIVVDSVEHPTDN